MNHHWNPKSGAICVGIPSILSIALALAMPAAASGIREGAVIRANGWTGWEFQNPGTKKNLSDVFTYNENIAWIADIATSQIIAVG